MPSSAPGSAGKGLGPELHIHPFLSAAIQNLHLAACLRKEEKGGREIEEMGGGTQTREDCIQACGLAAGKGVRLPLTLTACPGYQIPSCASLWKDPRHHSTHTSHSPLGGWGKFSQTQHKDKIEMQNPSIALNRTDWIRIFLLSSQLGPLDHWGPERRLALDRGRTAVESPEAPQH